jgi:hypothetical protein
MKSHSVDPWPFYLAMSINQLSVFSCIANMKRTTTFHVPTLSVSYCLEHCVGNNAKAEMGSVGNNIMVNWLSLPWVQMERTGTPDPCVFHSLIRAARSGIRSNWQSLGGWEMDHGPPRPSSWVCGWGRAYLPVSYITLNLSLNPPRLVLASTTNLKPQILP